MDEVISIDSGELQGWKITSSYIESPCGTRYTPGSLRLLEWKAGFYDRGLRNNSAFQHLLSAIPVNN